MKGKREEGYKVVDLGLCDVCMCVCVIGVHSSRGLGGGGGGGQDHWKKYHSSRT